MIVTISMEYGTGATAIAAAAAAALGYEVIDDQLPVVVAKRLQISERAVEAAEDSRRSIGERMMTGLELATPEVLSAPLPENFDETMLRAVQTAVREYAARGNIILLGRGAGVILGRRPDLVRVFLHAPRAWRIERIAAAIGDAKLATVEVDRIDAARRAYIKDWYGERWGDVERYDVLVDVSSFGLDGAAGLIVASVRARRDA
ncbi:MAG TPA: cytidylate kinase-like family protein [Candidatus Baltobacteraceae bacterium]